VFERLLPSKEIFRKLEVSFLAELAVITVLVTQTEAGNNLWLAIQEGVKKQLENSMF
jgi:hypothetical protein